MSANVFFGIDSVQSKNHRVSEMISRVAYPKYAQQNGIEGTVYVSFTTDSTGNIKDVMIVKSPHPCFNQLAKEAVRQLPIKPNNLKEPIELLIPLEYSLD